MSQLLNPEKRPISPAELFEKLMTQDFRKFQCQDPTEKLRQEKQIIIELITQYQTSIQRARTDLQQESILFQTRADLFAELQGVKTQRQLIDSEIAQELTRLQLLNGSASNSTLKDKERVLFDLKEVKCSNTKLKFKIRELSDYVKRLEAHNTKLEHEKKIVSTEALQRMRMSEEEWVSKVEGMKRSQEVYEHEMKAKLEVRQQHKENLIRQQEDEIIERNQKAWDQARARARTVMEVGQPRVYPASSPYQQNIDGVQFSSEKLRDRPFSRYRVI